MKHFDDYAPAHRCKHCGCRQDAHKGGGPTDPAHTCPPIIIYGVPTPFPRTTYNEDRTQNYEDYWKRIDAYWSAKTEFEGVK